MVTVTELRNVSRYFTSLNLQGQVFWLTLRLLDQLTYSNLFKLTYSTKQKEYILLAIRTYCYAHALPSGIEERALSKWLAIQFLNKIFRFGCEPSLCPDVFFHYHLSFAVFSLLINVSCSPFYIHVLYFRGSGWTRERLRESTT